MTEIHSVPVVRNSPRTLDDAGDILRGARKHLWKERGMTLAEFDALTDGEAAEWVEKRHLWRPDYARLIESGTAPLAAALIKVIYDQLATRPKVETPQGCRDYVQMMTAVREYFTHARTVDEVKAADRAICQSIGHSRESSYPRVQSEGTRIYESVRRTRHAPLVVSHRLTRKAEALLEKGFPEVEPWCARFEIREAAGPGVTERGIAYYQAEAANCGCVLSEAEILAGIYSVVARSNRHPVAYAASRSAAAEAARAAYRSQLSDRRQRPILPVLPYLEEVRREGLAERRKGNIASEDFIRVFGFRGVQFGNWAAGEERQQLLNHAHDAFCDLAELLHLPYEALSLNGTLGLALAARGGGRAAAHYEPAQRVVNMTKCNGAGFLAHEWAHAFDHYCGELDRADAYRTRARGASGWYQRPSSELYLCLRPELGAAWQTLMQALLHRPRLETALFRSLEARRAQDRTEPGVDDPHGEERHRALREWAESARLGRHESSAYYREALRLCGRQGSEGYWARPTELWARAFQAYIFDELIRRGARSDYLVHGVEPKRFAAECYRGNPYPDLERELFNEAIRQLIATLTLRTGHKNLPALY